MIPNSEKPRKNQNKNVLKIEIAIPGFNFNGTLENLFYDIFNNRWYLNEDFNIKPYKSPIAFEFDKEILIKNELRPLVYYLGMDGKWTDNGLQGMSSMQNQRLDLLLFKLIEKQYVSLDEKIRIKYSPDAIFDNLTSPRRQ